MFKVPEQYRVTEGSPMASPPNAGNFGYFKIDIDIGIETYANVIASEGMGWEHVSVHVIEDREMQTPTWEEMCKIKDLFWDKEDCVVQYHPPESEYVNNHDHVLHLWREIGKEFPIPDSILVGIKGL